MHTLAASLASVGPAARPSPTGGHAGADPLLALDRRLATELLDQQLWNLGLDITHAGGNLLLAFGFHRERAPYPGAGSSRYALSPTAGRTLDLWGWGAVWSADRARGVLLRRHVAAPRLLGTPLPAHEVWRAEQLPPLLPPRSPSERTELARWIGEFAAWVVTYETWVRARVGPAWREEVFARRPRHVRRQLRLTPSEQLPAWASLVERLQPVR